MVANTPVRANRVAGWATGVDEMVAVTPDGLADATTDAWWRMRYRSVERCVLSEVAHDSAVPESELPLRKSAK